MRSRPYDTVKRIVDVVAAAVGLVLTLPVQLVVAVLVRWKLGSPVLFRQQRPGKDEAIFELVKFRTMLEPDPERGLVSEEDRLTHFGERLRSTSLDELPTLWNVLKGDMSLVGPRPLLVRYLGRYSPEQRRRHEVRPGITGLAQVSGRETLSWPEKFALDVRYVEERSLRLDLAILLRTFSPVFHRHGVAPDGAVVSPEFCGSEKDAGQEEASRPPFPKGEAS